MLIQCLFTYLFKYLFLNAGGLRLYQISTLPYGPVLTPILQKILYLTHCLHNFSLYLILPSIFSNFNIQAQTLTQFCDLFIVFNEISSAPSQPLSPGAQPTAITTSNFTPSESGFRAYLCLTLMSSLSAHSYWSFPAISRAISPAVLPGPATELTIAYSRVHQAHTWSNFHGSFIVKSLLADEFSSLFLLSFIYLPEKKAAFNEVQSSVYFLPLPHAAEPISLKIHNHFLQVGPP